MIRKVVFTLILYGCTMLSLLPGLPINGLTILLVIAGGFFLVISPLDVPVLLSLWKGRLSTQGRTIVGQPRVEPGQIPDVHMLGKIEEVIR